MKHGDLILVPFPFTDLSGSKVRPALVLIASSLDVTLAFITTQLQWQESTDVLLTPDSLNGLKKPSLIRLSKLATIDAILVQGRLGSLNTPPVTGDSSKFTAPVAAITVSGVFADVVSIGS